MAPRTRSTTSSPIKQASRIPVHSADEQYDPVKVLITPKQISLDARVISLQHPSDGSIKRFYFCPISGLYEFKRTIPPPSDSRSILFSPPQVCNNDEASHTVVLDASFEDGFVSKDVEILTATPYDLAFILVRSIAPLKIGPQKALFQPLEDLLDTPESDNRSIKYMIDHGQNIVIDAMSRICDTVVAGDETMFRYSEDKILNLMLQKAQRVVASGLPASLEDRFVTRTLEPPMLSVKREDTPQSATTTPPIILEDTISQVDDIDSQSTTVSTTVSTVFSEVSSISTVSTIAKDSVSTEVRQLQQIRTAYNFIAASCLPSYVIARLAPRLSEASSPIDFGPLDDYLKHLALLRAEAAASRSMSDFSRKRGLDDEEVAEERAEKKKKQEEDEKRRKANESRGVRDLKKVNVSGMKKMSDFFTKKPSATKAKT